MIYFAVGDNDLAGGAMITASHNPGKYNGIKFSREHARAVGVESGLLEIKKDTLKDWPAQTPGKLIEKDIVEGWIEHVLSFIETDKLRPLKIAVDAGNGMAGKIFPELEPYVPFEVEEMYFELDGTFPNHVANPMEAKNIVDLQKKVKEMGCDVGIAFDGDGDRALLIDENSLPLTGSVMTALLAEYFLEKNPGATILYNAICGRIVPETIEKNGGVGVRTRVGHSFIKANMREHEALFAGEHSGHYFFKDNYNADSGLIASLIALYIISTKNKPLSKIVAPLRQAYYQIPETNFEVADKEAAIARAQQELSDGEQDMLDGLTVNYPNSWLNIRPSNTEPVLRLNAEAKSESELKTLVDKATQIITQS
jgi:phosphomannomutase